MTHHLHLLGTPTLESQRLERKTAAVFAYLALEGQTHKYKLSGWLWPDSGETAARNNMRQLLRHTLRYAIGPGGLVQQNLQRRNASVPLDQCRHPGKTPLRVGVDAPNAIAHQ